MLEETRVTKLNSISYILLTILVCECVAGSSGRWLEFGNLSIRMVIFIIAALATIPYVVKNLGALIKNKVIQSILIFFLFVAFSTIYGYIKGNNSGYVIADLTSFLFLLIIPCYIVICNTQRRIEKLIKYASYASVALAVVTIIFHFVLFFMTRENEEQINFVINSMGLGGFFNFGDGIYRIYFKSSVCFILPFLYNLDLLIKNKEKKRMIWPYIFMSVSLIAIVLTYTRSVWLGVAIAVIVYLIINHRRIKELTKCISIAIAGLLVFVAISWAWYGFEGVITNAVNRVLLSQENVEVALEEEIEGNDAKAIAAWVQIESDDIRTERLHAVYNQIKENWVLGSGLGQELKVRNYGGKIEYTYLDILSKMGVLGFMSFLLVLLTPFFLAYRRKYKEGIYKSLTGVMLCVMTCIYMSSIFNPFITSPIGFSLLAITVALIYALQTSQKNVKG